MAFVFKYGMYQNHNGISTGAQLLKTILKHIKIFILRLAYSHSLFSQNFGLKIETLLLTLLFLTS